jgi:hypothetical protein
MKTKNASKSVGSGSAVQTTNSPAKPESSQLFSRRQLAQRWNCCPHTIARRTDLNPLRFNRRLLRYRLEDIVAIEAAAAGKTEVQP